MSLTTASICISNYLGVPTELMNIITQYAATNDDKWVPHFDTAGTLHKKINGHAFTRLSKIYEMRVYSSVYYHVLVLNDVIRCQSSTRVIYVDEHTSTLYTKSEIYPGVFDYYTITYDPSSLHEQCTPLNILNGTPLGVPSRTSMATLPTNELKKAGIADACPILNLRRCKSGSIYMSGFTQSQAVTSFHMHGNEMYVSIIDEDDQEDEYDDYDDF